MLDAARVGEFVCRGLNCPIAPPFQAMGLESDVGNMEAGALFHQYTGANVELSLYAPGAFRLGFLRAMMDYAFRQLGCLRVTARTRRANKPMRRFLPKIGFRYEGVQRKFFGPAGADDAFLYGLMREDAGRLLR